MDLCDLFFHIFQGCFTGTGPVVWQSHPSALYWCDPKGAHNSWTIYKVHVLSMAEWGQTLTYICEHGNSTCYKALFCVEIYKQMRLCLLANDTYLIPQKLLKWLQIWIVFIKQELLFEVWVFDIIAYRGIFVFVSDLKLYVATFAVNTVLMAKVVWYLVLLRC